MSFDDVQAELTKLQVLLGEERLCQLFDNPIQKVLDDFDEAWFESPLFSECVAEFTRRCLAANRQLPLQVSPAFALARGLALLDRAYPSESACGREQAEIDMAAGFGWEVLNTIAQEYIWECRDGYMVAVISMSLEIYSFRQKVTLAREVLQEFDLLSIIDVDGLGQVVSMLPALIVRYLSVKSAQISY